MALSIEVLRILCTEQVEAARAYWRENGLDADPAPLVGQLHTVMQEHFERCQTTKMDALLQRLFTEVSDGEPEALWSDLRAQEASEDVEDYSGREFREALTVLWPALLQSYEDVVASVPDGSVWRLIRMPQVDEDPEDPLL